jgi:hypothetical protein
VVVVAALLGHTLSVAEAPATFDGRYGTSDISVLLTGVSATAFGH